MNSSPKPLLSPLSCGALAPNQGVSLSFQGQEKVLVTGPWYSQTSPYQILFGGSAVPTTLVQSGVLRCFAPGKFHQIEGLSCKYS